MLLSSQDFRLVTGDLDVVGIATRVASLVKLRKIELHAELVTKLLDNSAALADEGCVVGGIHLNFDTEAAQHSVLKKRTVENEQKDDA